MSSGAGAGVTFLGTGAGVKIVTPITSEPKMSITNAFSVKKNAWTEQKIQ